MFKSFRLKFVRSGFDWLRVELFPDPANRQIRTLRAPAPPLALDGLHPRRRSRLCRAEVYIGSQAIELEDAEVVDAFRELMRLAER
ncbi:MAG: hypothetical protein ACYC7B_02210 [Burkholderiales bacterium]